MKGEAMGNTELLGTEEVAPYFGKPNAEAVRATYRRTPDRLPPAIRIGTFLYWRRSTVDEWLQDRETEERNRVARDVEINRRMTERG